MRLGLNLTGLVFLLEKEKMPAVSPSLSLSTLLPFPLSPRVPRGHREHGPLQAGREVSPESNPLAPGFWSSSLQNYDEIKVI